MTKHLKRFSLILVGCLIVAHIVFILFFVNQVGMLGTAKSAPNPTLIIDPNVGASPTPEPTKPGIAIPGWAGLSIPAGVTEATLPLHNPEANKDWYYLTFELRLKDTNEVLFATGLIPPGLYCNKVELSRPLEAGTYQCVMRVQPYFIREVPSPTNNAEFDITVSVY